MKAEQRIFNNTNPSQLCVLQNSVDMGTAKRTRKFGAVRQLLVPSISCFPPHSNLPQVKRIIGQNDARLKKNKNKGEIEGKKAEKAAEVVREVPQVSSALFFQHNTALVPPYSVLVFVSSLPSHIGDVHECEISQSSASWRLVNPSSNTS